MDGVGTPIIGRPRPLPGHDTPNPAHNTYTLNYEEPVNVCWPRVKSFFERDLPTTMGLASGLLVPLLMDWVLLGLHRKKSIQ